MNAGQAQTIFLQALACSTAEQRLAYLEQACGNDLQLREMVVALLTAHARRDEPSAQARAASDDDLSTLDQLPVNQAGPRIGPYKLLQRIGEGGMGLVWMAEQDQPLRRRVAIKLIKAGLDNRQVIARFDVERQALALMDHPNIAKVFDAGTAPEGAPYFVMELVQGIPITQYCDQNKLSIAERLELFTSVCRAVQHAHQKGIIHRDLKPSNVLVCLHDGKPMAKVIDFGLAKALQHTQKLTERTMCTELGQVVGTLQYMSPEQAELNQLDVDTRTDIYSLGVMLYELLTGSTPIDQETLKQRAILQVLEAIREKDPPRPSARLSSCANEMVDGIAEQRRIDPAKLKTILRGDLDWIVMKALEKDRTRRYETATGFSSDLQRFLTGDVVSARPPSTTYRVSKFVRKHRGMVAALTSTGTLLIVGIIATGWFAWAANQAKRNADAKTAEVTIEKANVERERDRANVNKNLAKSEAERARASEQKAQAALAQTESTLARSNYFLALARWESNRARDANELLDLVPPNYRQFEWHLARREFQGGYLTCYGHQDTVSSVAFSPDGARLVSGSGDKTLKLWDAVTGEELRTLRGHTSSVSSIAFSPDGSRLVSGSDDDTLRLWNSNTGEELGRLRGHTSAVVSVGFSPDGARIVSGSADNTLKLWDAVSGEELRALQGHTEPVFSVTFSPDGTQVLSGSGDNTLKLWDAGTGKELRTFHGHSEPVLGVAFSPDGEQIVSASVDKTLKLWDAALGRELRTLRGHVQPVFSVAFGPDGARIVSGSVDQTVRQWDAATGEELRSLRGHTDTVFSVACSPDGARIASGSNDNTLKLWDAAAGQELRTLRGHTDSVFGVACSPNTQRVVSGSGDNTLKLWDAVTGEELRTFHGHSEPVLGVAFSPDGSRIASGSGDNTLKLWDAATGQELRTLRGHIYSVFSVAFSPDGTHLVSGSMDKTLKVWDTGTGVEQHTLRGHSSSVFSVAFSWDGTRIVSGSDDNTLKLWDATSGQELRTLAGHTKPVSGVAFSADGTRIVSASDDKTVKLWDAATGRELRTLSGHTERVCCVAFSTDGTRIVSGSSDNTLKLWDSDTGEELRTLHGHSRRVSCIAFSPDGKRLVSGSVDRTLKQWDPAAGQELRLLRGHSEPVSAAAISPDGRRLASGNIDKSLKLWDAASGRELRTLRGHTEPVSSIAFSPDGVRICARGAKGESIVWDVETGRRLDQDRGQDFADSTTTSRDGRWLVAPSGPDLMLVDLDFKSRSTELALRNSKAQLNPQWHREQASLAEASCDWYSAVFHRAWVLQSDPEQARSWDQFHAAHGQWLNERRSSRRHDSTYPRTVENGTDPVTAAQASARKFDPNNLLALTVRQMLLLPRGKNLSPLTESVAHEIHQALWNIVKQPATNDETELTAEQYADIRRVVEQFPRGIYLKTLGTAEYRLGNFPAAINVCSKAQELLLSETDRPVPDLGVLAILAMSHFRLGHAQEAQSFRAQFEEAIMLDAFKEDADCKRIAQELAALFSQ